MPSRYFRAAIAAAGLVAAGLLAGCVATTTSRGDISTWYDRSFMVTATQDGTLPVVVHGQPAASVDAAATVDLMTANISMPSWLPETQLVPGNQDMRYRMVLIFNPASPGRAHLNACGPLEELEVLPPAARIDVVGSICDGRDAATRSRDSVNAGDDPADATLRLLRQLTVTLMPAENPAHRANIRAGGP